MEEKINACQTLAELGELERTHLLNEEEQRLVFERRLQIFQKKEKGGMANAKMYTFLEQNIVGKTFLWLHKLKHKLTFGIIYFLKI